MNLSEKYLLMLEFPMILWQNKYLDFEFEEEYLLIESSSISK